MAIPQLLAPHADLGLTVRRDINTGAVIVNRVIANDGDWGMVTDIDRLMQDFTLFLYRDRGSDPMNVEDGNTYSEMIGQPISDTTYARQLLTADIVRFKALQVPAIAAGYLPLGAQLDSARIDSLTITPLLTTPGTLMQVSLTLVARNGQTGAVSVGLSM